MEQKYKQNKQTKTQQKPEYLIQSTNKRISRGITISNFKLYLEIYSNRHVNRYVDQKNLMEDPNINPHTLNI